MDIPIKISHPSHILSDLEDYCNGIIGRYGPSDLASKGHEKVIQISKNPTAFREELVWLVSFLEYECECVIENPDKYEKEDYLSQITAMHRAIGFIYGKYGDLGDNTTV